MGRWWGKTAKKEIATTVIQVVAIFI